ncbi:hypothetical protein NMY22_g14245 [Coprinellus aureogranulatus]|nr:hypothetical protein NMY22_g14245 [Coprinellus aureogranulatus]
MVRRSKRILYAQHIYPDADTVYLNNDLIFQILFYLDWPSLFRLSQASRDSRQLVREEFRFRLRFFLSPFITRFLYDSFMAMLRQTAGGIVGGIPYLFLTMCKPFHSSPEQRLARAMYHHRRRHVGKVIQLQVLVPRSGWNAASDWLRGHGYVKDKTLSVPDDMKQSFGTVETWNRPKGTPLSEYLVSIPCCITLSRVETDLVAASLSSPYSCHTNFITGTTILSMFPQATNDRLCLRGTAGTVDVDHPAVHIARLTSLAFTASNASSSSTSTTSVTKPLGSLPPDRAGDALSILDASILTVIASSPSSKETCDPRIPTLTHTCFLLSAHFVGDGGAPSLKAEHSISDPRGATLVSMFALLLLPSSFTPVWAVNTPFPLLVLGQMVWKDDHVQIQKDSKAEPTPDAALILKWPLVDCMYFGNCCTSSYIVPVPVQPEGVAAGRYFDVLFRLFVNANISRKEISYSVDDFMVHIDQYPLNSPIRSEFQYTLFLSHNPGDTENNLIRALHGGGDLDIMGSVLVVRSNREGIVQPVYEDDRYFIETMLIEILATRFAAPPTDTLDGLPQPVVAMSLPKHDGFSMLLPAAIITPITPPATPRRPAATSRSDHPFPHKVRHKPDGKAGWHEPPLILKKYRLRKMMKDINFDLMPFPMARAVFDMQELCKMILLHTDIYTIVAVSRVDKKRRTSAQEAFRKLFQDTIDPFIFPVDFPDFVDLMETTGLGVTGSMLRILLMTNSTLHIDAVRSNDTRWFRPNDLNIVVKKGQLQAAVDWFTAHGYRYFHKFIPYNAYKSSVTQIVGGSRPAALGQRTCSVTLTESVGNVLRVMFASPSSGWMNVMTAMQVISVYPTLITSRHVLRTNIRAVEYPRSLSRSFIAKGDNSEWMGECGPHCPGLPRKSVGDKGIASFAWNHLLSPPVTSRFPDTDHLLAETIIHWRMSDRPTHVIHLDFDFVLVSVLIFNFTPAFEPPLLLMW